MRDENRIREKLELSLDHGQVVAFVIGALVVMGVVFVLGVMVGKQIAPEGKSAPTDLLSAIDQKAVTDAGQVALTFQQELTAKVEPTTPPAVAAARTAKPVERPAPKVDPHPAEAKPEPKQDPKPVEAKADEPSDDDKADAKAEVAVAEPPKPAPKPVEVAKADDKPAPPPAPLDKKLSDAFSAAKKDAPKQVAVAIPTTGFTVQVAASQQKDEVDAVMTRLRTSGLRPYLVDAEIPGKGHWYRVRVGAFKTRDDAQRYLNDLKRETGLTAFVTAAK
ncbi:MAG: SPOR domain-containing protein [Deltaproteobacteria bacterium]|nr:SPOR domain-containing protein [Deltaproteobacteria bacterium]